VPPVIAVPSEQVKLKVPEIVVDETEVIVIVPDCESLEPVSEAVGI